MNIIIQKSIQANYLLELLLLMWENSFLMAKLFFLTGKLLAFSSGSYIILFQDLEKNQLEKKN